MPNTWGASQVQYPPFYSALILSGNVACPAGAETNVWQVTGVTTQNPGTYTIGIMGTLTILLGATPPTNLTIAARMNNGADYGNQTVPPPLLVANASVYIPVWIWNMPPIQTGFGPPGITIQCSVFPNNQPVTAINVSSALYYWFMRVGEY